MSTIPDEGTISGSYIFELREFTDTDTHTDYIDGYTDSVFGDQNELFATDELAAENVIDATQVNSPEFGVVFRVQPAQDATVIMVDSVELEVFYYVTGPNGTLPGDLGNSFRSIAFGPILVAVGMGGVIHTSAYQDMGSTWTPRTSGVTEDLHDVVWAGTQFIAVGQKGVLLTSPDGITWTSQPRVTGETLFSVFYAGGLIIVSGSNGFGLVGNSIADLEPNFTVYDPYAVPS